MRIPDQRWAAREGRWVINDGSESWVQAAVKTGRGDILIGVYRGGHNQQGGEGVVVFRSRDQGLTWTRELNLTERFGLRWISSWTTLRSGRILANTVAGRSGQLREDGVPYSTGPVGRKALRPSVYEYPIRTKPTLRTLYSDDGGDTWQLTDPVPVPGGLEYRLNGARAVEMPDGALVQPGCTFANREDERAWIFSPCVLRSTDGGLTWGDMTIVANGERDLGNCYNETVLIPLPRSPQTDWLAVFRMNPTHYGSTIYGYRSFSSDGGRTWSPPDQWLMASAEMDVLNLSDGGLMFTGVSLSGVRFSLSYDGGRSWAYQGHSYDKHPQEPQNDWHFSHALELDRQTVLSLHSPQNEHGVFGVYARWIRSTPIPRTAESPAPYPSRDDPNHRWVIRELRPVYRGTQSGARPQICKTGNGDLLVSMQMGTPPSRTVVLRSADAGLSWGKPVPVSDISSLTQAGGAGMLTLRNGRIVMAYGESDTGPGVHERDGELMPGTPGFRVSGFESRSVLRTAVSDDDGRTWYVSDPIDTTPFLCAFPAGRLVELADGDLIMPIHGHLSRNDMSRALHSCALLRSRDRGATWALLAVVATADRRGGRSFTRMSLLPSPRDRLTAAIETRYPSRGPRAERAISISVGSDRGKTWSRPLEMTPGFDPALARLPDNSVLCAHAIWTGLKFEVSHNGGVTWAYQDQLHYRDPRRAWGAGSPSIVTLDGKTVLAVYCLPDGGVDASWIRRVPRESRQARERFE